jgi:mannose-6-phosphate isomerase-like protein (cupin superfamily)
LTSESTPEWRDHAEGKWMILLRGFGAIDFYGEIGLRRMRVGDYVLIPAHQKHRITTTSKTPTTWLVVFVTERRVATKCRVKKKRSTKQKRVAKRPAKPESGQGRFKFNS